MASLSDILAKNELTPAQVKRRRRLALMAMAGAPAGGGVAAASIHLGGLTVPEDASIGDLVGALSVLNGSGSYTFTLTDDAGGKFAIDVANLEVAGALDYETATSHDIVVRADNGVDPAIDMPYTISVTNVLEVTLAALTIDADEIDTGSAENTVVGALQDLTSGSSRSLVDDAGGRFKLTGTNIVAGAVATDYDTATSHNITVRETHADASNSPRDSIIAITVLDEVGGFVHSMDFSDARNSGYVAAIGA